LLSNCLIYIKHILACCVNGGLVSRQLLPHYPGFRPYWRREFPPDYPAPGYPSQFPFTHFKQPTAPTTHSPDLRWTVNSNTIIYTDSVIARLKSFDQAAWRDALSNPRDLRLQCIDLYMLPTSEMILFECERGEGSRQRFICRHLLFLGPIGIRRGLMKCTARAIVSRLSQRDRPVGFLSVTNCDNSVQSLHS